MADGTRFAGRVFDGSGTAVNAATINLYDVGTVTPVRATTTTNSTGDWEIDHATRGLFDIEVVNGTTTRRITQDTEAQFKSMWLWNADADEFALGVTRTEDAASVEVAYFEGDRATPADADLAYISLRLSDSAGNQDEQARIGWSATTVLNGATQDGDLILSALVNNTLTEFMRLDGSASQVAFTQPLVPVSNDGAALGTTTLGFSDLHLATGGVVNWANGEVTITETDGNTLTIAGTATLIDLAAGILELNNAVRFDTGVAMVAASYSIGRDADATNQLHFNVPTGATYEWSTNDVSQMVFGAGILYIGDTANLDMTTGLTIQMGGADNQGFALKNSDVALGSNTGVGLSVGEEDTFYAIEKITPTGGGVLVRAFAEATGLSTSYQVTATGGAADTTKTTAGNGLIYYLVREHDGANAVTNVTANGNVFAVAARVGGANVTRFMVDEDGDIFAVTVVDVTGTGNAVAATAFDAYDDVALVRAFEKSRLPVGMIETEWDKFVDYNEDDLIRLGVLGAPVAEGGMWNLTQHTRLLNGALWQLHTRQQELAQSHQQRIAALEGEIAELRHRLEAGRN